MYVSVNRAFVFPITLEGSEDKVVVFETPSLGGSTSIRISKKDSLGLVKITNTSDPEPIPRFGDIIYSIFTANLENCSLAADPTVDQIVVFSSSQDASGASGQLEISYYKPNDEYRILSTPGFEEVSSIVKRVLSSISNRVVEFQYFSGISPDEPVREDSEEEEKEGDSSSLMEGVSELEKMYVESGRDTEEAPESE